VSFQAASARNKLTAASRPLRSVGLTRRSPPERSRRGRLHPPRRSARLCRARDAHAARTLRRADFKAPEHVPEYKREAKRRKSRTRGARKAATDGLNGRTGYKGATGTSGFAEERRWTCERSGAPEASFCAWLRLRSGRWTDGARRADQERTRVDREGWPSARALSYR
jgi:hypothetical protein